MGIVEREPQVLRDVRSYAQLATLQSDAYLERLNRPSPWTSRMMAHYRGMNRGFCSVSGSLGTGIGQAGLLIRFKPEPMRARLLWIEGKRAESPSFVPALRKKDFWVEMVQTGSAALERLVEVDPDLVVVNAASLRTSGKRICRELREKVNAVPIVVITTPEQPLTGEACASVVLTLPFTPRKLLNRILPLLPGDGETLLHVGHIRLDLERKRVRCQGREARLTPRLAHLLQVLMKHPGEVVERQQLFKEVWDTEYTEDTRTLDVPISWLREALEANPRKPQFLKTIRGVGYRLDL